MYARSMSIHVWKSMSDRPLTCQMQVTPGFTKQQILSGARENPRAPGGVFERVGALLSELLDEG